MSAFYHVPTTSRSIRFLLACLVRKLEKKGILTTELTWELDQHGMEAHYLNLLYNKKLNEPLVRTLFSQSVCPFTVDDCCHYEHLFKELSFGGFPFPAEGERTYYLELAHLSFPFLEKLENILGWPRDLPEIFFNYIETHPLAKSLSELTEGLGFKEWNKFGGKPCRSMSNTKMSDSEELRLDLPHKPKKCPFCHSSEIVNVIWGMPNFFSLKGNEFLYGYCIDPDCPPPAWYCNHCGLPIWRTSNLNGKNFEVSANQNP